MDFQAPVIDFLVLLPLLLVAGTGVLLMFWQRVVGFVGRLFGRSKPASPETPPSKSEQ